MNLEDDKAIRRQINYVLREYKYGSIDIHKLIQLIDMIYRDYLDFHPEARPDNNEYREYFEQPK